MFSHCKYLVCAVQITSNELNIRLKFVIQALKSHNCRLFKRPRPYILWQNSLHYVSFGIPLHITSFLKSYFLLLFFINNLFIFILINIHHTVFNSLLNIYLFHKYYFCICLKLLTVVEQKKNVICSRSDKKWQKTATINNEKTTLLRVVT